jgi:hypothetical protein
MSQTRFRQIARLEKLAQPYIQWKRQGQASIERVLRNDASLIIANLALLILYGNPKIDEPLLAAWERCRESAAWQSCREKHGGFDEYRREKGTPFDDLGASFIASYFRRYFIPELPGANETDKLNDAIFELAPPWLLWFTHGDVFGKILGLKLPDFSSVNRFARGKINFCELPEGPFECHPLPDGVYDSFQVPSQKDASKRSMHMTPRERKRTLKIREKLRCATAAKPTADPK